MSLKAFHVVFIVLALVLSAWTGLWALGQYRDGAGDGWLWLATACLAALVALVAYGIWFLRKTKGVSYL